MHAPDSPRLRALIGVIVALALPALAVVALHRLGSLEWLRVDFGDVDGWLRRTRAEDALAAVLRYVALVGGYWLLGSTLVYLLARISGSVRMIERTSLLTIPAVRRASDRLIVGTIAVSALAGPAIAVTNGWGDRQPAVEVVDPIETRLGTTAPAVEPVVDLRVLEEADEDTPPTERLGWSLDRPVPGPAIAISDGAHLEIIVREGDHLWALAERRISSTLGRPAADHEVAPYWREVVASNPEIRSGDPDVIYPGEVIVLPPLSEGSRSVGD